MNIMLIKWKIKKYHTVGIVLKSNIKIIEREKTDILNTQIHDLVLTLLGTRTEIKSGAFYSYTFCFQSCWQFLCVFIHFAIGYHLLC